MANKYRIQLQKKQEEAENTMSFYFSKPEGFVYEAGQTIDLTIPEMPGSNTRTFSLITEPQEDCLAIATRMTNSEYKLALKKLEIGDEVEIEGPYGSFRLHQNEQRSAVFLVGGIGITPFMGMIKDALKNKKSHKMYLFYSNRRPEDAAFIYELITISKAKEVHLTLVPTMTDMQNSSKTWAGENTYVNWEMIRKYVPESEDPIYYIAGAQGMVQAVRTMFDDHNVSLDDIRFEEFSGY